MKGLIVVVLPEKRKERLCEREVIEFGGCLNDTRELKDGARCRWFMKFYDELRDLWHASYPSSRLWIFLAGA
jgi:hypothetical protein